MALTPAQLATLKTDIAASEFSALPNNSDTAFDIAVAYNKPHAQTFFVWRQSVNVLDIMGNGFDWTRVDNMTVGKARIWQFMTALGTINPAQANVRAGIQAAFTATADDAMRQAIYGHCQGQATRAQRLFATGAGTSTTNDGTGPATTALLSPLTADDVFAARSLP